MKQHYAVKHPRFTNTLPMVKVKKDYNKYSIEQMFVYRWLNVNTDWMTEPIESFVEDMDIKVIDGWMYATFTHVEPTGFDCGDYDTYATLHELDTLVFKTNKGDKDDN